MCYQIEIIQNSVDVALFPDLETKINSFSMFLTNNFTLQVSYDFGVSGTSILIKKTCKQMQHEMRSKNSLLMHIVWQYF